LERREFPHLGRRKRRTQRITGTTTGEFRGISFPHLEKSITRKAQPETSFANTVWEAGFKGSEAGREEKKKRTGPPPACKRTFGGKGGLGAGGGEGGFLRTLGKHGRGKESRGGGGVRFTVES